MNPTDTLYTIGCANGPVGTLGGRLAGAGVTTVIDIRGPADPGPSADVVRAELEARGIIYHRAGRQLGGLHVARSDSAHAALTDPVLRGFADFMDSREFTLAMSQLTRVARPGPAALMGAPIEPLECRRSLIADYLALLGWRVQHLVNGDVREHLLRPEARRESVQLIYDVVGTE